MTGYPLYFPVQICWMCSATKGLSAASLPMAFSNISPDAPYWRTMFTEEPWAIRPSYTRLAGFETQLIKPDLLHIWHLGCGRDLAGSVIMYIVNVLAYCWELKYQGSIGRCDFQTQGICQVKKASFETSQTFQKQTWPENQDELPGTPQLWLRDLR